MCMAYSPRRLPGAAGWPGESRTIARPKELGGHEQDLVPQRLQRGVLKLQGQAESLEPVDQVVGQQEQMKVGLVGEEGSGGDAAQGVISFELLDQQLDAGPVVVEAPKIQWLQRQIGDQDLVVIFAEREERQRLGRFFGLGAADHHEAIAMRSASRFGNEIPPPRCSESDWCTAGAPACA